MRRRNRKMCQTGFGYDPSRLRRLVRRGRAEPWSASTNYYHRVHWNHKSLLLPNWWVTEFCHIHSTRNMSLSSNKYSSVLRSVIVKHVRCAVTRRVLLIVLVTIYFASTAYGLLWLNSSRSFALGIKRGNFFAAWRSEKFHGNAVIIVNQPGWSLDRYEASFPKDWYPRIARDSVANYFILPLWIPCSVVIVSFLIIRRKPFLDYQCRQCGYDLIHNLSGTCPECGTAITASQKIIIADKSSLLNFPPNFDPSKTRKTSSIDLYQP